MRNAQLWDDRIILNQRLSPADCTGFADIWQRSYWGHEGATDVYRPLSLSVLYLERMAFGDGHNGMAGYRVVSLAMHALVSLLVMVIASALAGAEIGWISALLFAAHPIHAEAVGMAYGQLELLSAFFVLLTLWFYARPSLASFPLSFCCVFLACCSKESGAMVLLLIPLTDLFLRRRPRRWYLALWLAPIPYLLLRYHALGSLAPPAYETVSRGYGWAMRAKLVLVAAGESVRLCVFPTAQSISYGHLRDAVFGFPYQQAAWLAAGLALAWLAAAWAGWAATLFGAAWFVIMFLPVSNLVPTGVAVAERLLYLPVLGTCFVASSLLAKLGNRRAAYLALFTVVAGCCVQSNRVLTRWRDNLTMWRSATALHPGSAVAEYELGKALLETWDAHPNAPVPASEFDEAARAFEESLELNPRFTPALVGAGVVAARRGDCVAARAFLEEALRRNPNDAAASQTLQTCTPR